jgi:hypothetical protein
VEKDDTYPADWSVFDLSREQALRALKEMHASAEKSGLCNMTLDEINATTAAARAERKDREKSR